MKYGQDQYINNFKAELAMIIGRKQSLHRDFVPAGLTRGEFFALYLIWNERNENPEKKGIHVSDLAKCLNIALSAASRMLGSLEERGIINRETDPRNRRNICVSLTEKGENLWNECSDSISGLLERVVIGLGEEDAGILIKLWKKFSQLMDKEVELIINEKDM